MWFSEQIAGLIGGIGGGLLGTLIGAWGAIIGIFARKGKFKKLILIVAIVFLVIAFIALCAGFFALAAGQPYHVWYPFALIGGTVTAIIIPNYIVAKRIYTRAELKKMNIDDL